MRMTHTKTTQISRLVTMLRKACHAPGCRKLRSCPNMCGCRTKRTFSMNIDTAICWEIADLLHHLKNNLTVSKRVVENTEERIIAYAELGRFHSSKGWQNFFWEIKKIYTSIMLPKEDWWPRDIEYEIKLLTGKINSLKRYPK